jgi:hypothetical protein
VYLAGAEALSREFGEVPRSCAGRWNVESWDSMTYSSVAGQMDRRLSRQISAIIVNRKRQMADESEPLVHLGQVHSGSHQVVNSRWS